MFSDGGGYIATTSLQLYVLILTRAVTKLDLHSWMVAELLMLEKPTDILLPYILSACHKKIHHRLTAELSKPYLQMLLTLHNTLDSSVWFQAPSNGRTAGQKDNNLLLFQSLEKLQLKSEITKLME